MDFAGEESLKDENPPEETAFITECSLELREVLKVMKKGKKPIWNSRPVLMPHLRPYL